KGKDHLQQNLNKDDLKEWKELVKRMEVVAQEASRRGVRLLIDAEQTPKQPAVDFLVLSLSRTFNKERPVLYNTYQMYLVNSMDKLKEHLEQSKKDKFCIGIKLVRGAYID